MRVSVAPPAPHDEDNPYRTMARRKAPRRDGSNEGATLAEGAVRDRTDPRRGNQGVRTVPDLAQRGAGAAAKAGAGPRRMVADAAVAAALLRSEERRVGKECRSRWAPDEQKKYKMKK